MGTWGDFADGIVVGAIDGAIDGFFQMGIASSPAGNLMFGEEGLYPVNVRIFGPPDTIRGQFGYDVGPGVPAGGAVAGAAKLLAGRGGTGSIDELVENISEWLGPRSRALHNDAGDLILISENGAKRIRFDINRPYPHGSPHSHVEELIDGTWNRSGPIFPRDVAPE